MIVQMQALEHSGTWELVLLSPRKKVVGCRWVYAIKVGPNGEVHRLKARLVAKGYTQIYGLDYGVVLSLLWPKSLLFGTYLPWLLLVIGPYISWILNMPFFTEKLDEKIYMEQPPGFVA